MKFFLSCMLLCFCTLDNATGVEEFMTSSDFVHIRDSPFFVDKTELIRKLVNDKLNLHLIGPSGFGKSSALTMVKTFLELQPHPMTGAKLPVNKTKNHEIFLKQPKFTKQVLNIHSDKQFFYEHFGRYPVVYFNFSEIAIESGDRLFVSLRLLVRHALFQHQYLWGAKVVSDADKMQMRNFIYAKETPEPETLQMIPKLLVHLFRVYNEHAVILIDNFDDPVLKYMTSPEVTVSLAHLTSSIGQFLQTLLSNRNVAFSLILGETSYSEVYSSFVNNIKHSSIFSKEYAPHFGYAQYDVRDISDRCGKKNYLSEFMDWYDGYNVEESDIQMYSATSVTEYFFYGVAKPYWIQTQNPTVYAKFFKIELLAERIWRSIRDFAFNVPFESLTRKVGSDDVNKLQRLFETENPDRRTYRKGHEYVLLRYMAEKGFFNTVSSGRNPGPVTYLRCPNREIRTVLTELLYTSVAAQYNITKEEQKNYKLSLSNLKYFTLEHCLEFVHHADNIRKHTVSSARYNYQMAFSINLIGAPINFTTGTWLEFNHPEGGRDRNAIIDCVILSKNDLSVEGSSLTAYIPNLSISTNTTSLDVLKEIVTKDYHKFCYSDNIKKCVLIGLHDEGEQLAASILVHEGDGEVDISKAFNVKSSTPLPPTKQ